MSSKNLIATSLLLLLKKVNAKSFLVPYEHSETYKAADGTFPYGTVQQSQIKPSKIDLDSWQDGEILGHAIFPAGNGRGFSSFQYNLRGFLRFVDPDNQGNKLQFTACNIPNDYGIDNLDEVHFHHSSWSLEAQASQNINQGYLNLVDWIMAYSQNLVAAADYKPIKDEIWNSNLLIPEGATKYYEGDIFTWHFVIKGGTSAICQIIFADTEDNSKSTVSMVIDDLNNDVDNMNIYDFQAFLDYKLVCHNKLPEFESGQKSIDTSIPITCAETKQTVNPCIDLANAQKANIGFLYNKLPDAEYDLVSYAFETSDDTSFGRTVATHTCDTGYKLYPTSIKEIGADSSDIHQQTSTCEQMADEYNYKWTKLKYECLPPVAFVSCESLEVEFDCKHGTCTTDGYSIQCECDSGFEPVGKNEECDNQINECAAKIDLCENGSECIDINPAHHEKYNHDKIPSYDSNVNGIYHYACKCPPEYNSSKKTPFVYNGICDEAIDDCLKYGEDCKKLGDEDAVCQDLVRTREDHPAFRCECSEPLYSFNEQSRSCVPNNPCKVLESPCNGNGRCKYYGPNDGVDYECKCLPSYTGKKCETQIDYCATKQPCENGECKNFPRATFGYVCVCDDGFIGRNCDQEKIDYVKYNFILTKPEACSDPKNPADETLYWKNTWKDKLFNLFVNEYGAKDLSLETVICKDTYQAAQFVVISPKEDGDGENLGARSFIFRNNQTEIHSGMDFEDFWENARRRRMRVKRDEPERDPELNSSDREEDHEEESEDDEQERPAPRVANLGAKLDDFLTSDDAPNTDNLEALSKQDDLQAVDPSISAEEEFIEIDVCAPSVDDDGNPTLGGCKNGALCEPDFLVTGGETVAKCICDYTGYEGQFCETPIDYCKDANCQNGSDCVSYIDDYFCDCPFGFDGKNCENNLYPDGFYCYNNGNGNPCQNEQLCNNNACQCKNGMDKETGVKFLSAGNICEEKDFCGYSTETLGKPRCANGGHCFNEPNNFVCVCLDGFSGPQCQFNIEQMCAELDCSGNGECAVDDTDENNVFVYCNCDIGYMGEDCFHRNACKLDRPCSEFTIEDGCTAIATNDGQGDFTCDCISGYEGKTCDIGPCDAGSSKNTCNALYDDLSSCVIKIGSDGVTTGVCSKCLTQPEGQVIDVPCELWSKVCRPNICDKKGSYECQADMQGNRICLCNTRYSGDFCEDYSGFGFESFLVHIFFVQESQIT